MNKKKFMGLLAFGVVVSLVIWAQNTTWELPTLYREDPIELGTYTVGKIELSEEFSRRFNINPAIGQNMQVRLMEGGVDGELLINEGTRSERIVSVRFSANPMAEHVKIGGVVSSMRFRILDPNQCLNENQRRLAYVIHLTDKPRKDWYTEAGNAPLEK